MSSLTLVQRLSPELRASIFHFTVFLATAASSVYLGIWLSGKGISSGEIGIINAVPVLLLLALNLFVGRIADRASDWKQMIVIMALLAGVASIGLFFVNDFWGILIVWTLALLPSGSIAPVLDAATMRMSHRNGSDFGFIRAWGTVGYMLATALTGLVVAYLGPNAFVPLFVAVTLVRAGLSFQLPLFRAPAHEVTVAAATQAGSLRDVMKLWFILPILAFALVNCTHAILSAFVGLVWNEQGVSPGVIGLLVTVMAAAEATTMFFWRRVGKRVSARWMILASALVTILRWSLMALTPPVWVLFLLQTLHSITYALGYLGTMQFVASWTSEKIAAEAQGFSFVMQQGMSVLGLFGFGWLVAVFGAKAFFACAALGALGAVCVIISLRLKPTRERTQLARLGA
jgi:PPP family 3-phenylpropionic acid transporter